ncbi:MAG TPA: HAD-IIIA family hydrolase [Candidatus Limnocylindria bacterium]|nr:HAD-IIIA family hydrolase [Candidatus Limnocylindria bacterium]
MKAAVFFERDGILNLPEIRNGRQRAPLSLSQFRINLEVAPLLRALKEAGFVLIATTNQPMVEQGLVSRDEVNRMHAMLMRALPLDDVFMCPYDDASHPCFKPQPGMLLEAAFKWVIDLNRSYVISDKGADAKAAQIVGCTSVMVRSDWVGGDHHDFVVESVAAATGKILELNQRSFRRDWAIA